jgi:DNA invertase Pin-like site-specific DNA recombinase
MDFISYFRVSTERQGRSGLGLEAQEACVRSYVASVKGNIIASYTDVESGKSSTRPEFAKALAQCRAKGTTLLVAKLDRLSRSVSFIFQLLDSKVDFVCADMPQANTLTIGIIASLAQYEREQIAKRTRDALRCKKARGESLGNPANLTDLGRSKGSAAIIQNAKQHPANRHGAELATLYRAQGLSLSAIASKLNEGQHTTRRGKAWSAVGVMRILKRAA